MQEPETKAARMLNELAASFASLSPARRENLLRLLRDLVAALDDDPGAPGLCHAGPGRVSV